MLRYRPELHIRHEGPPQKSTVCAVLNFSWDFERHFSGLNRVPVGKGNTAYTQLASDGGVHGCTRLR
jgi:hypothetical protein